MHQLQLEDPVELMSITKGQKRRPEPQRIHDLVIAALASEYTARGYTVHTNPNQQKNWAIEGHYPVWSCSRWRARGRG